MEPLLKLDNVNVTYLGNNQRVHAVRDVNLAIDRQDSLGIVGESGSGKTTLAMALLRLLPADSAEVSGRADFLGRDLIGLSQNEMQKIRWSELSVVFQKSMNSLSPVHSIGAQFEDIYRVHRPAATKREIYQRAVYLFELVNLPERMYKLYPHQLSGGMMQRVAIALSLLLDPKLLILDEATTALDVVTQGQILDEILSMEQEFEMTRIMITHDISVVAVSCNKIAVMYAGELMETGLVSSVLAEPKHPYTKGLLASIPTLKGEQGKLSGIGGFLPDLARRHEGCLFAPRCPRAMEKCRRLSPDYCQVGDEWMVRCHLYGGEQNG